MADLQDIVVKEMKVRKHIGSQQEIREIIQFTKNYVQSCTFIESLVLGISGSQDSALTGKLAQLAAEELRKEGGECQFIAVKLPYDKQKDADEVEGVLHLTQPDEVITVNIKPAVDQSIASLKEAGIELTDFQRGNEKAGERMKIQFSITSDRNGIIIGTDHSAENITGFYTKCSDGTANIAPIFGLDKRQGRQPLEYLEVPTHLYEKVPTADLKDDKPQLPDEETLGVTYNQIDGYLEGKEISSDVKTTIENHYVKNAHKRELAYTRYTWPKHSSTKE